MLEPLEERQMLAVFTNSTSIAIPGAGTSGPADPYPSSISVPALPFFLQASIVDVNVTLRDLTHPHPDDIEVLLVAPGGQNAIVMADVGGGDDVTNVTLELDDEATSPLPDNSPLVSGTFQPANYGGAITFSAPAPTPSGNVALSTFDGLAPGGTWQLFIQDDAGGDEGDLNNGWSLEIILGADVVIDGTNLDDVFVVDRNGDNVRVRRNGVTVFDEPQEDVSSLTINGLIGNDLLNVDSTNGLVEIENGIRFDGGTGFDRIDVTQAGGAPDDVLETLAIGPLPGKGRHTIVAGDATQRIDFENIEPFNTNVLAATFNITSVPGIATLLDADNAINYVAGTLNGPTWGRVTVDSFEPIEFINKTNLVVDAGAGSDEISLNNPNTPTGLTGITVNGQDPTGSDTLIINGVAATTLITLNTSTITGASGAAGAVPIVYSGIEHITAVAGASTTLAVANSSAGSINYTITPGAAVDEGTIQANLATPTIPIAFKGYGSGTTLEPRGDAGFADDSIILFGSASNDSFIVLPDGSVGFSGRATISKDANIRALTIDGLDGDDTFAVVGNHPWLGVNILGGDPSASDVLNFVGNGGNVSVDAAINTITEAGFGGVTHVGVEQVRIGAGGADLSVALGIDDEVIHYTPLTTEGGRFSLEGSNIQYAFEGVPAAKTFSVEGGIGATADELQIYGTNNHDVITINSTNRTATVENAAGTVLRNVTLANTVEVVRAFGLLGNDTFLVVPAPAVPPGVPVGSPGFVIPQNLLVYVDGGPPGASDALVVAGLSALSPFPVPLASNLFTIVNRGRNPNEGVVRIFQDQVGIGNEPFQFPDIVYSDVEVVSPIPFVNAQGDPQLLILGPDQYEPNEFRANAAFIGAGSAQNVVDLSIFPNAFEHRFVQADQDYFRVIAQYTGVMDFQVYFKNVPEFLPGNGDLDIQVRDEDGNIITGFGVNDFPLSPGGDERRRIPVVAGETYFVQVFGKLSTTTNAYSMSIINTPAPVPRDLELDDVIATGDVTAAVSATNFNGSAALSSTDDFYNGKYISFLSGPNNGRRAEILDYVGATRQFLLASGLLVAPGIGDDFQIESIDTGRTQFDNTTRDATPTIFIRLDDDFLLNDLHGGGTGQLPPDNQVIPIPFRNAAAAATDPGYRVAIFDEVDTQNPVFQGFADQVPGQPGVYTFTFTNPLPDGSHFLTAKVQMVDPSTDHDRDFGAASVSLEIVVDTLTPPVFFGDPVVIDDGLDAASDSGVIGQPATFTDGITNDVTPTFWGTAEANSVIRLYVDLDFDGIVDPQDPLIAMTTAIPIDGSNQFPHGRWTATSNIDLNDPAYFPFDGLRQILVTAEDLSGNVSDEDTLDTLQIFLDTRGPQVADVFITDFPDYHLFDPKPSDAPTPLTDRITIKFTDLPPRLQQFLYPAVNEQVATTIGNYQLVGDHTGHVLIKEILFDDMTTPGGGGGAGPPATGSGGVIIDGGDRDDHGSFDGANNVDGWQFIEQMVGFASSTSQNSGTGILAIGASSQALSAIQSVATVLGLPLTVATTGGAVDLSTVTFTDYAILYVPSNEGEVDGGVSNVDLATLTARKLDVQNFVNTGGSLVALTEASAAAPYSWLELPALFVTAGSSSDTQYQTQALIDAGLVITDAELTNGTPLHSTFAGPPGFNGLQPFVYNVGANGIAENGGGDDEIVTLGLGQGSVIGGGSVMTNVTLVFDRFLPDDRYTLLVRDSIVDDAGNNLDGESQAASPFDEVDFQDVIFPSGDGQPGGNFEARFTIDSRPEIGDYAAASIFVDINGNFVWDPEGQDNDATNRDLVFTMGVTNAGSNNAEGFNIHDSIFAGNFANGLSGIADGYDKLAAYGFINGRFRWLIDTDHNGVIDPTKGDFFVDQPSVPGFNLSALPIAGNWDPNHDGDEIGLFDGTRFLLDTNGDNVLDGSDDLIFSALRGSPIAGDFDGDGLDDLGTWRVDVFSFDLANDGFGDLDDTINFGFPGVAEKPVAADMDQDGIDDVGLFVPRRSGTTPEQDAEWYFLLSNHFENHDDNGNGAAGAAVGLQQSVGTVDLLDHPFSPVPLGQDLFAQWGDEFAIPIVGNFDPPVAQRSTQLAASTAQLGTVHAPQQAAGLSLSGGKWVAFDTLRSGTVTATLDGDADAQVRLYDSNLRLLASGTSTASATIPAGMNFAYIVGGTGNASIQVANHVSQLDLYDVTRDGQVLPQDVLSIIDNLHRNGFRAIDVVNVTADLYFDTSLDGQITPQDVLAVLDYINRRAQANGTGGGLLSSSESAGGLLAMVESSEQVVSSGQGSAPFLFVPNAGEEDEATVIVPRSISEVQLAREASSSSRSTAGATATLGGFSRGVAARGHVVDEAIADEEDWLSLID